MKIVLKNLIWIFMLSLIVLKLRRSLALVAHAVTQAFGGVELEDGSRTDVQLLRLHAHCGVCTSPTVMLNPIWSPEAGRMTLGVV